MNTKQCIEATENLSETLRLGNIRQIETLTSGLNDFYVNKIESMQETLSKYTEQNFIKINELEMKLFNLENSFDD
jgi:hypothetical protein